MLVLSSSYLLLTILYLLSWILVGVPNPIFACTLSIGVISTFFATRRGGDEKKKQGGGGGGARTTNRNKNAATL